MFSSPSCSHYTEGFAIIVSIHQIIDLCACLHRYSMTTSSSKSPPPSRCSSHSQQCSTNVHISIMNTVRMLQSTFSSGIGDYRSHICLPSTLIHHLFCLIHMDYMQMCARPCTQKREREMMDRFDRNYMCPRTCLLIKATNGENMTRLDFAFLRETTIRLTCC